MPGYGGTVANLVAARHRTAVGRLLRRNRAVQAELARSLLVRLARLERETQALTRRIGALVEGHPLLGLPGAGPITVARLIAEVGDVRRFRSADAFAALAGVAPIPASSGQVQRMRLNRGGNRQLNRALYVIAVTQSRFHPPAKAYVTRRIGGRREDLAGGDPGPQAPAGPAGVQAPRRGLARSNWRPLDR